MAKQALADVEARHRDIMKLEKDIVELQEMFVDFAAMIEDQVNGFWIILMDFLVIDFDS